jgi:lauroyl/myristoyl acyltransferase
MKQKTNIEKDIELLFPDDKDRCTVHQLIKEALKDFYDKVEKWFDEERKNNNLFRWHNDEIGDELLEYLKNEGIE